MGSLFNLPPKSIRRRRLPRAKGLISMGIMGEGGITGASERDSNLRPADYERAFYKRILTCKRLLLVFGCGDRRLNRTLGSGKKAKSWYYRPRLRPARRAPAVANSV